MMRKLIGKKRWELDNIQLLDDNWDTHRAVLEAHRPFRDLEYSSTDGKGETRFISISGTPFHDAAGIFLGYRGFGRDITTRKRIDRALVRSERLLRLSQQSASIGSYVIDLEMRRVGKLPAI